MARATTRTLLPLDRWAEVIGYNPIHFNQVVVPDIIPNTVCDSPLKQWAWQETAQIGREDIAQAIQDAERTIGNYLGYTLLPSWQADERQPAIRPARPEMALPGYGYPFGAGYGLGGYGGYGGWGAWPGGYVRQHVKTNFSYYVQGGIERKTLIDAGAAVVYTDEDSDGYEETATVVVATTVTEVCEIAVYFPGEAGADDWEVRPLRSVVIAGGNATIRMWRHQLVLPELWDALAPQAVDGTVDANFLTTVDVYQHDTDPQQQVQMLWTGPVCGCVDGTCEACLYATQMGCLLALNPKLGLVTYRPGTWDADAEGFTNQSWALWRDAEQVRLWYYAGWRDMSRACPNLQMDPAWERAVAYYSLALLDRDLCGCDNLQAFVKHWREELNLSITDGASSTSYSLGTRSLENPFGQTRGALYAWNVVNRTDRKVGQAVKL